MHAVDPLQVKKNAKWMTQAEIADLFEPHVGGYQDKLPTRWITLSGGNPCIHDLTELVSELKFNGYYIAVETQGTFCPDWLLGCQLVTVSPKGPGMGEKYEPAKYNAFIAKFEGAKFLNTKVVVFDERDIAHAERVAVAWINEGYSMSDFYLSQGNPFPPGNAPSIGKNLHISVLRDKYLELFDKIKQVPILSQAKWLPQWHVWLWSNQQGV